MTPRLSIVIPAFNEAGRILQTLERILDFIRLERIDVEVLVVNDGSTDGTGDLVRKRIPSFAPIATLRVLDNPGNRGKGYSVRHGVLESKGKQVLFSDSDLASPIEEYHKLAAPLNRGEASIAFGSRALKESQIKVHESWLREWSGRTFNLLVRVVSRLPFKDTQCGFKLFTREAADAVFPLQTINGFGFDVEILYIARKLGFRMVEVPVVWSHAAGSRINVLTDGARMFWDVLSVRYQDLNGRYIGVRSNGGQRT